jgi:hypothetical protein
VTDIEPIRPADSTNWTKVVHRRRREDDEPARQDEAFEEEPGEDEDLPEDEDGHQHIDVRV